MGPSSTLGSGRLIRVCGSRISWDKLFQVTPWDVTHEVLSISTCMGAILALCCTGPVGLLIY